MGENGEGVVANTRKSFANGLLIKFSFPRLHIIIKYMKTQNIKDFIEEGEKDKCPYKMGEDCKKCNPKETWEIEFDEWMDRELTQNEDNLLRHYTEAIKLFFKRHYSSRQISLINMIMEICESEKYKVDSIGMIEGCTCMENYCYCEHRGHNQALDTIVSKLKEIIN